MIYYIKNKINLPLNEGTVIKDRDYNRVISVTPDPDRDFEKDPYFKFYKTTNTSYGQRLMRISIYRPELIIHKHGYDGWDMFGAQDKKVLIKILTSINPYTGKTYWEETLDEVDNTITKIGVKFIRPAEMPNYMLLPAWQNPKGKGKEGKRRK